MSNKLYIHVDQDTTAWIFIATFSTINIETNLNVHQIGNWLNIVRFNHTVGF